MNGEWLGVEPQTHETSRAASREDQFVNESQNPTIITGLIEDLEALQAEVGSSAPHVQWKGKHPLEGISPEWPVMQYPPEADEIVYVLTEGSIASSQLKLHFDWVPRQVRASRGFLVAVGDADAKAESIYFDSIKDLPVISLDELRQMIQPR